MAEELKSNLGQLHGQPLSLIYRTINNLETTLKSSRCSLDLISSLDYNDSYERLLKLKLVDKFELAKCVVDILKSEDPHLIRCALQFHWFFEGGNDFVNVDYFATNVFPYTSVLTRGKIIKQLSLHLKNESIAENFFNFVREKYGTSQALCLLEACKVSFVISFLKESDIVLTSHQLICLFKKSQDTVLTFLADLCQKSDHSVKKRMGNSCNFFLFLAREHPDSFLELHKSMKDHMPNINLGRRSTKKLILTNKSVIVESAEKFISMLKHKHIHKYLTAEEFESFYFKMYPESISSLGSRWSWSVPGWFSLIDYLSDEEKAKMISNTFEKKYGKTLIECEELVPEALLKILPLADKYKIGNMRYTSTEQTYMSKNCWICYSPLNESIPKIKELLKEANDGRARSETVPYLVETCRINNSTSALLDVLKYFASRFRNDDVTVRMSFVNKLMDEFDVLKLTEEHWSALTELLQISIFNKELPVYWMFTLLLEKCLCYNLLKASPTVETLAQQYIKVQCYSLKTSNTCNFLVSVSKCQKQCLLLVGKLLPTVQKLESASEPLAVKAVFSLLESLHKWNSKNKRDNISITTFPWLIPFLSEILQSKKASDVEKAVRFIYTDVKARQHLFTLMLTHAPEPLIILKFLKQASNLEERQFVNILNYMIEKKYIYQYRNVLRQLVTRGIFQFINFLKVMCKELIEGNTGDKSCKALYVMSIIDADAFISVVKNLCPSDSVVNVFEEGRQSLFDLQKVAAKSLANVKPLLNLEILLPFCQGDYLKIVLGSLISISLNSAEIRILPFLQELSGKPTSVKKHAFRLLCHVLSMEEIFKMVSAAMAKESHPSIRKVLLGMIFHFFSVEPTEEKFTLLKSAITSLTTKDKVSLDLLTSVVNVPDNFKSELFQLCWNVLLELDIEKCRTLSLRRNLLNSILNVPGLIDLLPDEFFHNLFNQFLFKLNGELQSEAQGICCAYLLSSKSFDIMKNRIAFVGILFKNFVTAMWDYQGTKDEHLYPGRKIVYDFIDKLCMDCLNFDRKKDTEVATVLDKFFTHYTTTLRDVANFKCFVLLRVYCLFFRYKDEENLITFGKEVGKFIDDMVVQHGPLVVSLITEYLSNFVYHVHFRIHNRFYHAISLEFVSGILCNINSPYCMLAGIELLPIQTPYDLDQKERMKEILIVLHNYNGKDKQLVQLYLGEKVSHFY